MKPDFERFRLRKGEPRHAVNVLMPQVLYDKLKAYAGAEGDTVSGLIVEGAARVDIDRQSDPDYAAKNNANVEIRKRRLRAELAVLNKISPPRT